MTFVLLELLSPDVARVLVGDDAAELWVRDRVRKTKRCALCRFEIGAGEPAWRTTRNSLHQAVRICRNCWNERPASGLFTREGARSCAGCCALLSERDDADGDFEHDFCQTPSDASDDRHPVYVAFEEELSKRAMRKALS